MGQLQMNATATNGAVRLFYKTKLGSLYHGDSLRILAGHVKPSSVALIMTSPPFGLVRWGIARSYEALGDFEKALAEVNYLLPRYTPETMAAPDLKAWKEVLEAAAQKRYDMAAELLRKQLAIAPDWKKKSDFLEQRLRLMEERARDAGQLPTENSE